MRGRRGDVFGWRVPRGFPGWRRRAWDVGHVGQVDSEGLHGKHAHTQAVAVTGPTTPLEYVDGPKIVVAWGEVAVGRGLVVWARSIGSSVLAKIIYRLSQGRGGNRTGKPASASPHPRRSRENSLVTTS